MGAIRWALGMALLGALGPVRADWHGALSFLTDYVYRGYSKSRGNPVAQGSLEFEHESGGFAGLSISQVGFDDAGYPDRSHVEFRPHAGWSLGLGESWRAELEAMGYLYDGRVFGQDSNYAELYAALNFRELLTARVGFAPNAYQRHADTLDYELQGRYDLLDNLRLSAGLGYYQAGALLEYDYFYWNAGLTWYPCRYVAADLRYVDANAHAHPPEQDGALSFRPLANKVLFSISVGF